MAVYRPFIEAVQWIGINVTEIRQFVRTNQGYFNEVVIRDGVLYVQTVTPQPIPGSAEIAVPVTNWVVRSGDQVSTMTNSVFISQYVLGL